MNRDADNKGDKFQFIELFLVAADVNRTFVATRLRRKDDNGDEFVIGYVKIHEGEVIGSALSELQLERQLDEICLLKIDHDLHCMKGKSYKYFQNEIFYN